jgi:hypothetical protein
LNAIPSKADLDANAALYRRFLTLLEPFKGYCQVELKIPKVHHPAHLMEDTMYLGAPYNYNAQRGERGHKEFCSNPYDKTNKRDYELQASAVDVISTSYHHPN